MATLKCWLEQGRLHQARCLFFVLALFASFCAAATSRADTVPESEFENTVPVTSYQAVATYTVWYKQPGKVDPIV